MLNIPLRFRLLSLLCVTLIFMAIPLSRAVDLAGVAVVKGKEQPPKGGSEVPALSPEVSLLREQNKILLDHQANLLTVVTWSLGTLVTVAALLVGFGWWTNFKFYETDKLRLRDDLESKMIDLQSKAKIEAAALMLAHERVLDDKLDSKLSLFRTEFSEMKSSVNSSLESIGKQVRERKDEALTLGKSLIQAHKGIANAEADLREVEEQMWLLRNVPVNILLTQFQGIRAAKIAENEPQIRLVFERMGETLKKHFIDKGVKMATEQYNTVHSRLKALEGTHPIIVAELLQQLESVKRAE